MAKTIILNMKKHLRILLVLISAFTTFGAQRFRTDINPALRYYQAFLEAPDLPGADHDYLFQGEWRGKTLEPRFGTLVGLYDYQFRFLREAARATAPCDWGIDLSEGPDALLPGLARAKATAQAARLRVMWDLQNGRQAEARDDLLAVMALAHQLSRDGVLISALVQIAMENILATIVAENFYQWQPETLRQIDEGLEKAPARGTIAQCVAGEKISFHDWMLGKVLELRQENAGNEARTMEAIRAMLTRMFSANEGSDPKVLENVLQASGGTTEGMLRLVRELAPFYARVTALMTLPYGQFEAPMKQFMSEVKAHSNPLVPAFFSVFEKCRAKEFGVEVTLAMLRAGIQYKIQGEEAFRLIQDPCGKGPFAMRRFVLDGVDRGFEVRSPYSGRGFDEVLIFVEKNGPPFVVTAKNAGKPVVLPEK